jgi:hypothetical protein
MAAAPAPTQLLGSEDAPSGAYDGVVVVVVVVDVVVVDVVVVPAAKAEAAPSPARTTPRTRNQTPRRIA